MKVQPKVAAKSIKKPAAKAKAAAKAPAKAAKPAARKPAPPLVKKPLAKTAKPAAKVAAKASAKPATKTAAPASKATKPLPKAAPQPARSVAGKALGAVAKVVVSGAKAVVAAAKKLPAKASSPPDKAAAAKASPNTAVPNKSAAQPAPAPAPHPAQQARPAARAMPAATPAPAPGSFGTAKATYTPMATQSALSPPPAAAVKKDPKLANNWKTKSIEELVDAEVLAMPDTEYMNDKQMAFFRLKLLQLKTDILNSAGETTEHLREDTVIVPDPADRATIEEEHALELRTRDRERKLLKKISQSITRIDASDYGFCDETGEPIGLGRLLARPTATLSLEAQQRRELKQKMFGD